MPWLEKRGGTYRVKFRFGGKVRQAALKTGDETAARRAVELRAPRGEVRPVGGVGAAGVRGLRVSEVLRRLGPDVFEPRGLVLGARGAQRG